MDRLQRNKSAMTEPSPSAAGIMPVGFGPGAAHGGEIATDIALSRRAGARIRTASVRIAFCQNTAAEPGGDCDAVRRSEPAVNATISATLLYPDTRRRCGAKAKERSP